MVIPRELHIIDLDLGPATLECAAPEGWELTVWTAEGARELFPLRNQATWDEHDELRADVLRYELLDRFGGIAIDPPALLPPEKEIEDSHLFASWEVEGSLVSTRLIGATPAHPFIDQLIQGIPRSVAMQPELPPGRLTGAYHLTRGWQRLHGGMTILPKLESVDD
jgi:hypothetical protein